MEGANDCINYCSGPWVTLSLTFKWGWASDVVLIQIQVQASSEIKGKEGGSNLSQPLPLMPGFLLALATNRFLPPPFTSSDNHHSAQSGWFGAVVFDLWSVGPWGSADYV